MNIRPDMSKAEQGGRDLMQWMREHPTQAALNLATASRDIKKCRNAYRRMLKGKQLKDEPQGYDAYVKYLASDDEESVQATAEKRARLVSIVERAVIAIGSLATVAALIITLLHG